jgi:hypothetical protein
MDKKIMEDGRKNKGGKEKKRRRKVITSGSKDMLEISHV